VRQRKRDIRREIRKRIEAMSDAERASRSRAIVDRLMALDAFRSACCVFAYYPLPDEVDIVPLLRSVLAAGKHLYLPRIARLAAGEMAAVEVTSLKDLDKGRFDILEPRGGQPLRRLSSIDLVIVPGRAFDAKGRRVGRGGGYYDRFFEKLDPRAKRIGVAFQCQIVDEAPAEAWDALVDMVVTEEGIIEDGEAR
jgi:5-formyltetrahydrofolate cyclo-ligase